MAATPPRVLKRFNQVSATRSAAQSQACATIGSLKGQEMF